MFGSLEANKTERIFLQVGGFAASDMSEEVSPE